MVCGLFYRMCTVVWYVGCCVICGLLYDTWTAFNIWAFV